MQKALGRGTDLDEMAGPGDIQPISVRTGLAAWQWAERKVVKS